MKYKIYIILLLLIAPIFSYSQSSGNFKVKRERTFTGAGLYGFMNGGADLYLEYGVKELITRDIIYNGEEFTIDVYDMPSPADAFGIYSLHTFKCLTADTLNGLNCLSPYQLQLAVGNKYISVVFPSGSNAAKQAAFEIVKNYIDISKYERLSIPTTLNLTPPYSGVLKYLKGPLSVSNAESSLLKIVDNIPFSGIWLINNKASNENKALIHLTNKNDIENLKAKIESDNIIETGEDYIYFKIRKKEQKTEDFGKFGF